MAEFQDKKYILWDHDGVLVDTEKWYFVATRRALSELEIRIDEDLYLDFMQDGRSLWVLASEKGVPDEIIKRYKEKRNTYYQEFLVLEDIEIPGVEETLGRLYGKFGMAIVTTSKRKDFELIHRNRSLVKYMNFVLCLEDYYKAKPEPEPYLAALKRFGADTSEAVVIEDSGRGLKSALAAGIDCIIVKNDFTSLHDFSKATRITDTITDLIPMFS